MFRILFLLLLAPRLLSAEVVPGIERLLSPPYSKWLKGKRIGLVTNQTGIFRDMQSNIAMLDAHSKPLDFELRALFSPEHGLNGSARAWEKIDHSISESTRPIYSLYGNTRKPTAEMLKDIDLLLFDIQDIGSRSYTYLSTLCYVMEAAAKANIPVVVTDRPNPINGVTVDGPMLEEKWRSFVGYINVPYCHGMTLGELALFFNKEYQIGCKLGVVPMLGWRRHMTFRDTELPWIPTSPHIPEADSPLYYPATGILGELQLINIGVGYTLPFKLVGAPWLEAQAFADKLNAQHFPGVHFQPYFYRPFYGRFKGEDCQGVLIRVTDPLQYKPVATQYLILGILKVMYPKEFQKAIGEVEHRKEMFCKVNGTEEIYRILTQDAYIVWKLRDVHQRERRKFVELRQRYLLPDYG